MNDPALTKPIVRWLRSEQGQVLPMVALMMVVMIGFVGYVVDIGRVWIAQRQLQNAVDAAALVAGQDLPDATLSYTNALAYGGTGKNALNGYGVTASLPSVTFKCLQTLAQNHVACATDTSGTSCHPTKPAPGSQPPVTGTGASTTTCNAVVVTESATVSTTFAHLFLPSFNVTATSTASARGGVPHPLDVAVVIDTTASMNDACGDNVPGLPNGSATKIDCAKQGVRTLLSGLLPCNQIYQSCAGEPPLDQAALLVFPEVTNPNNFTHDTTTTGVHSNLSLEYGCPGNLTTAPSWYQSSSGQNSDEAQKVTLTGGIPLAFTLTFGGQTTLALPKATTTAATLQTALQGLSSIGAGNAKVTGNTGGPFTVTFVGALGNQNVAQMSATGANITTTSAGAAYDTNGFPGWYLDSGDVSYGAAGGTYDLTGLLNDYKTSDTSALNSGSDIVSASSWDSCGALSPNNEYYGANSPGGAGTYYADAIKAAQALLAQDSSRGAQHVIILLSDGQATTDVHGNTPCADAVSAAQAAATAGTWVYSVVYGDTTYNTSCDSKYTAVGAMQYIARNQTDTGLTQWDPNRFFCDPVPSNMPAGVTCNGGATLNEIFQSIGTSLTGSRLIPDNTS